MFLQQETPSNNETCGAGIVRGYQMGSLWWSLENNNRIGKIIGDLEACVQTSKRKQPDQRNLGDDGRLGGENTSYQ